MLNSYISILAFGFFQVASILNCFSATKVKNDRKIANQFYTPDEIIFYSTGSSFSPVITLRGDAEVIWTWDDNTTSNSTTPTKDYGSDQLRRNSLKVTPWSAVRRINIGYDADDGGSKSIELVNDQKVSLVENLNLVAPYLQEWCSSYNKLISLDFSNFINIETIECYLSNTLQDVTLTNTPKLKRACFEENNLLNLNLSSSSALEDLRGAVNNYSTIILPNVTDNVWHLCLRDNPQITDQNLLNNLSLFPKIAELWIWNSNQKGDLIIPQTNLERTVSIMAYRNRYSSVDFRGALMNPNRKGLVYLSHNELTKIDISGCIQIIYLDLSYNKLESSTIDQILKQVDEFGTSDGNIDLRFNQPPTFIGLEYIANLKNRGWTVNTDPNIPIESISVSSASGTSITTDNGTTQLSATIFPANATTQSVTWSTIVITGKASISTSGLLTAEKDGTVKAIATASDGSGVKGELLINISNQIIPVESILVTSPESTAITTDNGTIQLSASVLPTDATNKSITWSVINLTGKASISASGLLTAEKNGTVKAIATAIDGSGVTGEILITISNQVIPVEIIDIISPEGNSINSDNGTLQLQASVLPNDATTKTVSWSVIDLTGKASISASGLLTAEKNGTVKAIATAMDGSGVTGEILITISNQVIPVEIIDIISPEGNSINSDNGTLQLQASVLPNDATTKTVSWSVIDLTGKASISASGLLTAEKNGTVKAIATAIDGSGKKGEIIISISNQIIPIESISISSIGDALINTENGTLQLQASILPTDATIKTVVWSVIDVTGKATISSLGLITAQKDGIVKVIAAANNGSEVTGEILITITNQIIPVESISVHSFSGTNITTDKGTLQLNASILPIDATIQTVTWSVVDLTGKATISTSGLLTAEKDGTVKAIATATDGSGMKGELTITISNQVILIENLTIIDDLINDTIKGIGTKLKLKVLTAPQNATNSSVRWIVENITGRANIDQNGELTTISPGKIQVIAEALDGSKFTDKKEYNIAIPVLIQQHNYLENIRIFPNPTSGKIQIHFEKLPSDGVEIEIRNPLGQTFIRKQIYENISEWLLEKYPFSIYFVTITDKNKSTTHKIINGVNTK